MITNRVRAQTIILQQSMYQSRFTGQCQQKLVVKIVVLVQKICNKHKQVQRLNYNHLNILVNNVGSDNIKFQKVKMIILSGTKKTFLIIPKVLRRILYIVNRDKITKIKLKLSHKNIFGNK